MKNIIFICLRYLDENGNVTIGGIQTYISNLITISKDLNLNPIVIQPASNAFKRFFDGVTIIGVETSDKDGFNKFKNALFDSAMSVYHKDDIIVFTTERLSVKNNLKNTIGIQHGISWDITTTSHITWLQETSYRLKRFIRSAQLIQDARRVKVLVCVDHNYINWLRTQVMSLKLNYYVIPNFSVVPKDPFAKDSDGTIRVIFSRRLQEFRGTKLFGSAIKKVLDTNPNVIVTIAGDGPDEEYLKALLKDYPVSFITYASNDAQMINSDKHIAVVPSLGSEGTSLSLIEAMACGCAPIATDVGGMTDIVIDQYNGLLIKPDINELTKALNILINDESFRNTLANNAYQTVRMAFSYDLWELRWKSLISQMISK